MAEVDEARLAREERWAAIEQESRRVKFSDQVLKVTTAIRLDRIMNGVFTAIFSVVGAIATILGLFLLTAVFFGWEDGAGFGLVLFAGRLVFGRLVRKWLDKWCLPAWKKDRD